MRTFCRIIRNIIPLSEAYVDIYRIPIPSGNRAKETELISYFDYALGEAPQPGWGLPKGWDAYIAGAALAMASLRGRWLPEQTIR